MMASVAAGPSRPSHSNSNGGSFETPRRRSSTEQFEQWDSNDERDFTMDEIDDAIAETSSAGRKARADSHAGSKAFPNASLSSIRDGDFGDADDDTESLRRAAEAEDSFADATMDGYSGAGLEGSVLHRTISETSAVMRMKRARYFRDAAITGVFVLLWYFFATLLSLYNKWMFSPQYYGFTYPLFVTSIHMVVQFALSFVVREVWSARFKPQERPNAKDYGQKIVPTAITTGLDIGLSNLSLKTITLSLYTMCKSSTLIFVLGFAFAFQLEQWSIRLIAVIVFISFGVFLMVFNATTVSIPGIIMVFSASALAGLRWALTQLLMHKREMGMTNPFATIFWLSPVMGVTLALISMVIEGWHHVFWSDFFSGWKALQTLGLIVFPGTLAFSMVASEYYIIQRAGIVPLSIAGIFKEVSTITVSAWVFGDELTPLNELGVLITVCGIATFSYHKYQKSMTDGGSHDPHETMARDPYEAVGQDIELGNGGGGAPMTAVSTHDRPHVLGDDIEDDGEHVELKRRLSDQDHDEDDGRLSGQWRRRPS